MIRPATYPIQIISRSHFDFTVQITSQIGGEDVDLSNDTILAQLWDRSRLTKYIDLTVDTSRAGSGLLGFSLTADQTTTLPTVGVYDVKVIHPDSKEYYLLQGPFTVSRGYTDD